MGAVSRKLIILHLRFYHGANELLALDISKPDEITAVWRTGPVWQSEADISDDWKVQVINETAFVFKAPNRMPCIDFFNATDYNTTFNVRAPTGLQWPSIKMPKDDGTGEERLYVFVVGDAAIPPILGPHKKGKVFVTKRIKAKTVQMPER